MDPVQLLLLFALVGTVFGTPFGVVGALLMAVPMSLLEEGRTPADAAASAVRGIPLSRVRPLDAWLFHFGAGAAAGAGAGIAFLALDQVASSLLGPENAVVAAGVAVTVGLAAVLYGFFSLVVLPTRGVSSVRARAIRRHWVPSALLYAVFVGGGMAYTVLTVFGRLGLV